MCVYLHWLSFNIFFQVYIEYVKRTKSFNTFDSPVLVQKLIYWSRREELFLPFFGKQKTRTTLRKIVAYSRFRVARVSPKKKILRTFFFLLLQEMMHTNKSEWFISMFFPRRKEDFLSTQKKNQKIFLCNCFQRWLIDEAEENSFSSFFSSQKNPFPLILMEKLSDIFLTETFSIFPFFFFLWERKKI